NERTPFAPANRKRKARSQPRPPRANKMRGPPPCLPPAPLDHLETHTDTRIEQADRRWNDLSHHPRALAAAKNEQAKLTLSRRSIGNASRREHLRAQGIARECHFRVPVAIEILERAESGRNGCNTRRQKSVGAPHYAILFVQDRRHVAP